MATFQVESWRTLAQDADRIFLSHWADLALDKEEINLSVNHELYIAMNEQGKILVVTARVDSHIAGYIVSWMSPHPHYLNYGLQSTTDAFYVLPQHRRGGLGVKMFLFNEAALRDLGVRKMTISTKVHEDHSAIFEALGWTLSDKVYTKLVTAKAMAA